MAGLCIRSIALAEVALLVHSEGAFLFQNTPFFSVFFFPGGKVTEHFSSFSRSSRKHRHSKGRKKNKQTKGEECVFP